MYDSTNVGTLPHGADAYAGYVQGLFPTFAALRAHAATLLASYKVPRYWQAVEDLPRTPTSRVAKHRLPQGHPPGEWDAEADGS